MRAKSAMAACHSHYDGWRRICVANQIQLATRLSQSAYFAAVFTWSPV